MTDETKHTPAPWGIWSDQNGRYVVGPSINLKVADLYHPPLGGAAENAKLIAAAPEMLEALKAALEYFPTDGVHFDKNSIAGVIESAIAKAEGRSK